MRDKKSKDLGSVCCIKGEDGELLVKVEDDRNRWKDYFNKLFNENGDYNVAGDLDDAPFKFCQRTLIIRAKQLDWIASSLTHGNAWAILVYHS